MGAAMAGYRTGSAGDENFLKDILRLDRLHDRVDQLRIHTGMGDEHTIRINIIILIDGVLHILEQNLIIFTTVLFAYAHRTAVIVVDFDRGLEAQ